MTFDGQTVLVVLLVVAAVVYLGRRTWLLLSGKAGGRCGGCCQCDPDPPDERQIVPLDPLTKTHDEE